ncbi:MAG TPA: DNRLRE domain-containing protein [Gaiellaceae bacterium]
MGASGSDPVAEPDTVVPGEELPALRSETTRTYRLEDGTYSTLFYAGPINYRDEDGVWRPIDDTLVPSSQPGYAYENKANRFKASLPASLADGPVRFALGDRWATFALEGAVSAHAATVVDEEAKFPDVLSGVTVEYAAVPNGLKESIVLADPTAASTFAFALATSPGLTARVNDAGGIDFIDEKGARAFSFAPPFMVDAGGGEEGLSNAVSMKLVQTKAGVEVVLSADAAWLLDPAREWPVTVDPSVTLADTQDCHIASGIYANTSYCLGSGGYVRIGYDSGYKRRGLFQFNLSSYKGGQTVTSADLALYCQAATTTNGDDLDVRRITRSWTNGATWNKYDGTHAWTTAGGDYGSSNYDSRNTNCSTLGWKHWYPTLLVQYWVDGTYPNYGLLVKQRSESITNLLDFTSIEGANATHWPYLQVDYTNVAPSQPTTLAPADGTTSTSRTPTLSATYLDADPGDSGYVKFEVCSDVDCANPVVTGGSGTDVASGQSSSWTVPANVLQVGTTYYWHARGFDGTEDGAWTDETRSYRVIAAPVNSALPAISGSTRVGQVLNASNGTWSDNPTAYSYQWRTCDLAGANCANISGATASTYTIVAANEYKTFRVVVTATNAAGSGVAATSAATDMALRVCGTGEAVTATITAPTGTHPTVSGSPTISASATSARGKVTLVEFYFDGLLITSAKPTPATTVTPSISWNTLDPAQTAYDGDHIVTATGYDGCASGASPDKTVAVANRTEPYKASFAMTGGVPLEAITGAAGENKLGFYVTVTNDSATTWSMGSIFLRYRWMKADGTSVADGPSVSLGRDVPATGQDMVTVTAIVDPPTLAAGVDRSQLSLRFDLYNQATSTWFASKGNQPLDNPVQVNKDIQSQALGLERYYGYDREDLGAGMENLVNAASGDSIMRWTPLSSPGRGLSTVVDITYNSLEEKTTSPLGNNFSLSISSLARLGLPLDIHPNNADNVAYPTNAPRWIAFTDGDGTRHKFVLKQAVGGLLYGEEPAGVHLWLRELAAGDPNGKWAITRPDRVTFYYDVDGYPVSVADRNGNKIAFTLADVPAAEDPGGLKKRVTQVTDAGGRAFTIAYWAKSETKKPQQRGKVKSIADHGGHELDFDYYDDGNLLRITEKGGTKADGTTALPDRSFVFTYTTASGSGPVIPSAADRVNPDPRTAPQSSSLFSVRDPRGSETTFAYCSATSCSANSQNRWKLQSRTNRAGKTTSFTYDIDQNSNPIKTTVTAPLSRVTEYTLGTSASNLGSVLAVKDALGKTTNLEWSSDRQLTKVIEPSGAYTTYAYNDNGDLTDQRVLTDAKTPDPADDVVAETKLDYQAVTADSLDVAANWRAGRTIAHVTQLVTKTDPNGMATATPTNDYQWTFAYDGNGNLTRVTDPEANSTTYEWDTTPSSPNLGTLTATTDPRGQPTPDANDFRTQYLDYDGNGLATRIVNPKSAGTDPDQTTLLNYDADGLLRWIQDARHASDSGTDTRSYRTTLDYDSFHRLGRVSTPKLTNGERGTLVWTNADYDANDSLVSQTAPAYGTAAAPAFGAATAFEYDLMDRPSKDTEPPRQTGDPQRISAYTYDDAGRLATVTLPRGTASATVDDFTTEYGYDPLDRVVMEKRYADYGSSWGARITRLCYDPLTGDVNSLTPPRGGTNAVDCSLAQPTTFSLRYAYDAAHRLTGETDALGRTRGYGYDANGNLTSSTDENGTTQTRSYDQRNLLTHIRQPFDTGRNVTTHYVYDGVGNVQDVISPRAWDASTDPEPNKTHFSSYVTSYAYDAMNRLVKTTLPKTGTETQAYAFRRYDAGGNLLSVSIPVGTNDPAVLTNPGDADKRTDLEYFDPGWIRSSDEPATPKVTFADRAEGWQSSRTPAGAPSETWAYYTDGHLQQANDRNGNPATFTYDLNGNLTSAVDSRGAGASGKAVEVQAQYNGFDELKLSEHRRQSDPSDPDWHVTTYAFDLGGNVNQRTDPDGHKQHFVYDASNRLGRQVDDNGTPSDCTDDQKVGPVYTATGWESERTISRAGSSTCVLIGASPSWYEPSVWTSKQGTSWTYFLNGKLKTLNTVNGAPATIESHTVGYLDGGQYVDGNRTSDSFTLVGPNGSGPCATSACLATYGYDGRDRLTQEVKRGVTTTYTLDLAGNVTCQASGQASIGSTYVGNQLQTQTAGCPGTVTSRSFYDADGRLDCVTNASGNGTNCLTDTATSCPTTANANVLSDNNYDQLNRLTRACTYASGQSKDTAAYVYDALGRPISETARRGATGTPRTTTFGYLGMSNLVSTENVKTSSGSVVTDRSYTYDAFGHRISLTNAPGPAAPTNNPIHTAGTFTYAYDVHGSVSALIDENGSNSAVATYGYTPYGQPDPALTSADTGAAGQTADGEDALNPYRYSAKRLDPGSGTYDMGARRFGPDTSRFLQQDLYRGALDDLSLTLDPLSGNRYALASGNPVGYAEGDGHWISEDGGGGAASIPRLNGQRSRWDGDSSRYPDSPSTLGESIETAYAAAATATVALTTATNAEATTEILPGNVAAGAEHQANVRRMLEQRYDPAKYEIRENRALRNIRGQTITVNGIRRRPDFQIINRASGRIAAIYEAKTGTMAYLSGPGKRALWTYRAASAKLATQGGYLKAPEVKAIYRVRSRGATVEGGGRGLGALGFLSVVIGAIADEREQSRYENAMDWLRSNDPVYYGQLQYTQECSAMPERCG